MRRASSYAMQARKRFCEGRRIAPIELVLSGQRSLEDWVELLHEERERFEKRNQTQSSSSAARVSAARVSAARVNAARVPLV